MENAIIISTFPDAMKAAFGALITIFVYSWPLLMTGLITIWSLDDVGAESAAMKDYGSEVNAFQDFMVRFDRLSIEWKRNNPVLITTNLTKQAMQERYGDRVMSRLSAFPWFEMTGADRRAK
jgi:hypothetical protein